MRPICYYPFGSQTYITPEYNHYNTNVINLPSELQSYMVLASEYHTKVLSNLNSNNKIVWWLSVDNYFRYKDDNAVKKPIQKITGALCIPSTTPEFAKLHTPGAKSVRHRLSDGPGAEQYLLRRLSE